MTASPASAEPAGFSAIADIPVLIGARAQLVFFASIDGWTTDDQGAAWTPFRESCQAFAQKSPALRPGAAAPPALGAVCQAALELPAQLGAGLARAFFERHFQPLRIEPETGAGFLTGYFEPEVEGSLKQSPAFSAPVYGRPSDLVTVLPGEHPAGFDPSLFAARRTGNGIVPYVDREAIYAGALAGQGLEILYLRDEPEVFIVQVQGSARVRLAEGGTTRLVYGGRSGHPYTSIGRALITEGKIAQTEMSLERLMAWLRANPEEARALMARNRSYIFFRRDDTMDPSLGPIGGAGLPLTSGRSLAVDRGIWPYGLPVWIGAALDTLSPGIGRINRLMVAQDTGSAIVGPARADYFWGTGTEAGRRAGLTRHATSFTVLWPKATASRP